MGVESLTFAGKQEKIETTRSASSFGRWRSYERAVYHTHPNPAGQEEPLTLPDLLQILCLQDFTNFVVECLDVLVHDPLGAVSVAVLYGPDQVYVHLDAGR